MNNTVKQDFILELMVFSPKYNAVNAEELANQLSDEQLQEYLQKLREINQQEAEQLAELEESQPEEYAKRMREREEAEKTADEAFFSQIENNAVDGEEKEDKALLDAEKELDVATDKAEKDIDAIYKSAEDVMTAFFDEEEEQQKEEVIPVEQKSVEPERSLSEITDELHKIAGQSQDPLPPHDPAEEAKTDNWQ